MPYIYDNKKSVRWASPALSGSEQFRDDVICFLLKAVSYLAKQTGTIYHNSVSTDFIGQKRMQKQMSLEGTIVSRQ